MAKAVVYWIHLPDHTDILSEGYVGVTKFPEKRLSQHRNGTNIHFQRALEKYGNNIVFSSLIESDEDYCYHIESKLRLNDLIGWNMQAGGLNPQLSRLAAAAMTGIPKSEEHKAAMRGKRPHVNQSGARNNNAKKIETPYGVFDSIKDASVELNISYQNLWYKLRAKHTGWRRI